MAARRFCCGKAEKCARGEILLGDRSRRISEIGESGIWNLESGVSNSPGLRSDRPIQSSRFDQNPRFKIADARFKISEIVAGPDKVDGLQKS
jgi:hypothetical protein